MNYFGDKIDDLLEKINRMEKMIIKENQRYFKKEADWGPLFGKPQVCF